MTLTTIDRDLERQAHTLYGSLWPAYPEADYEAISDLFDRRLAANGFDLGWFRDKRCLDAGCGNGRFAYAMVRNGARRVVACDLSEGGLADMVRRLAARDVTAIEPCRGSVLELPFADKSFDFVGCNGVLHHTIDPWRGLGELSRVTAPGGTLWLYLYGRGGLHWHTVDTCRRLLLHRVDRGRCLTALRMMNVDPNHQFDYMDDWYTPIHERYTPAEVEAKLAAAGFSRFVRLTRGVVYDTDEKITTVPGADLIFGCGDLRYLAQRDGGDGREAWRPPPRPEPAPPAPDPGRVRDLVEYDQTLMDRLAERVEGLDPRGELWLGRVAVALGLHRKVRDLMNQPRFDLMRLAGHLNYLFDHVEVLFGRGDRL